MREFFVGRDAEVLTGEGEMPGLKIWRTHMGAEEFGHMACRMEENLYFLWVKEGEMVCQVNQDLKNLQAGEGIFVNGGQAWRLTESREGCSFALLELDPEYIKEAGEAFVFPLLQSEAFSSWKLELGTKNGDVILSCLQKVESGTVRRENGWELEIKGLFFQLWASLYREFAQASPEKKQAALRETKKLQGMLTYLHSHYQEKLTLAEMASASNVSTGEYCRFFKKHMQQTPVEYLQTYRIEKSLPKIVKKSESMPEIAAGCGFAGASYYSETFKKEMGCSPGEYRKWYRREVDGECPLRKKHALKEVPKAEKTGKTDDFSGNRKSSMPTHLL